MIMSVFGIKRFEADEAGVRRGRKTAAGTGGSPDRVVRIGEADANRPSATACACCLLPGRTVTIGLQGPVKAAVGSKHFEQARRLRGSGAGTALQSLSVFPVRVGGSKRLRGRSDSATLRLTIRTRARAANACHVPPSPSPSSGAGGRRARTAQGLSLQANRVRDLVIPEHAAPRPATDLLVSRPTSALGVEFGAAEPGCGGEVGGVVGILAV